MKKFLISFLIFTFIQTANATTQYRLIINAEKFDSDLHLYVLNDSKNSQMINELFSEKSDKALSSFAKAPDKAGASLKKILEDADKKLEQQHIPSSTVTLSVFGTDGMRSLSKEQQLAIYDNVKNLLQTQYDFKIAAVKTVSGKMQGIYDWLAVNYLENNFSSGETDGVIDMGDDTTQVVFQTTDKSKPQDEITVDVNHQEYTLFSKSFSGFGISQVLFPLHREKNYLSCYQTGHYLFSACQAAFLEVISKAALSSQLIPLPTSQFAVIARAPEIYEFFGVEDGSEEALNARIEGVCEMSWDQMKQEYADSGIPEEKLFSMCADGIYLDALFYHTYHLSGPALWVTNKAHDGLSIDWTLGVLLYKII